MRPRRTDREGSGGLVGPTILAAAALSGVVLSIIEKPAKRQAAAKIVGPTRVASVDVFESVDAWPLHRMETGVEISLDAARTSAYATLLARITCRCQVAFFLRPVFFFAGGAGVKNSRIASSGREAAVRTPLNCSCTASCIF